MAREFETLKGTIEYLPKEQTIREHIKETLKKVFVKYGFPPAETPILCMYDLLASKYSEDADILNETYKLSDQGKRELGLRYDLTICFAKMIATEGSIVMPFKRYEMGKVFRDGPVKVGRNREFTQCDVDVVGIKSMMQDAEFMNLTYDGFKELGLEVEIHYNNRKLLQGLIKSAFGEISQDELRKSIMLVDKLDKMTRAELSKEFQKLGKSEEQIEELLNSLYLSMEEIEEQFADSKIEILQKGLEEVRELVEYTKDERAFSSMVFSPYLARGIDIYTGTVWEIFLKNRKVKDHEFNMSIGGGGRYDHIITSFIDNGQDYPAIGMSFGLDVIYEILSLMQEEEKQPLVDLFIIPIGTQKEAMRLTEGLREKGLRVEVEKMDRRVKKSMNYANKEGIPFVIVLGEDEIKNELVDLKNMITGETKQFGLYDTVSICKDIKNR